MYNPPSFAETDHITLQDFMSAHSFATLISQGEAGLDISHLPLLLDRQAGEQGTLVGHFARANSHWKRVDGQNVTVLFHGPHAYISPAWYEVQNSVPTWNYVAVHAHGVLRLDHDPDVLLRIVRQFTDYYEAPRPQPWSLDSAEPEFIQKLIGAIVGFRIEIQKLEGKWKLSQNHDVPRRQRTIQQLRQLPGEDHRAIADLMEATLPPN